MFPWVLTAILAGLLIVFFYTSGGFISKEEKTIITQNTILQEVENMGKLELVKYNFRDITELEKEGNTYDFLGIINWGDDAKMALVSVGSATGCIDLQKINPKDVRMINDTVYVQLPQPELCYYKLDMEETHIYSLETGRAIDKESFIQEGYRLAERRIKETALKSGILEQTNTNARLILKPILETIVDKPVIFTSSLSGESELPDS